VHIETDHGWLAVIHGKQSDAIHDGECAARQLMSV
jgi:hypothetical protein